MERIKEAVKLAREERMNTLEPVEDVSASSTRRMAFKVANEIELEENKAAVDADVEGPIQYSKTKSVEIPPWVLKKNRVVAADPRSPEMSHFKILRTQVLQGMKNKGYRTLGVVSSTPGEGKTLTGLNLAYSIALEARHTALIVDLDLRKPSLHKYFDYEPEYGITDYLNNGVPLDEILFSPNSNGLVVLPGREQMEQSSEILSSNRLINLVEELRDRYPNRIVLFDLPPLLVGDDVLAFSPYLDSVLLVIENAKVKNQQLQQALEMIKGTPILGSVLNKSGRSSDKNSATY